MLDVLRFLSGFRGGGAVPAVGLLIAADAPQETAMGNLLGTLPDVIGHYNGRFKLGLIRPEINDLAHYLQSL
jgi:hypothetical protein